MKRKNTLTYSQAAKRIIKKYDKRLGDGRYDKLAADSLNRELEQLAAKQEAAKEAQTQAQFQEMAMGGVLPQMWAGGTFDESPWLKEQNPFVQPQVNPYYVPEIPNTEQQVYKNAFVANTGKGNYKAANAAGKNYGNSTTGFTPTTTQNNSNQPPTKNSWFDSIPQEALYGMLAQGAGVGLQALLTKKPKDINARATNVLDYVPVRDDEAKQAARLAFANQQANSRYLSPSQYMAQMQGLGRGEAQTLAQISERTTNANAQGMNQWNQQKAGFDNDYNRQQLMADQYNNQNQMNYNAYMAGVPGELGNVFAGGMKDTLGYKNFNNSLRFASTANRGTVKGADGSYYPTFDAGKGIKYYEDNNGPHYIGKNGKEITPEEYFKLLGI